MREPRRPDADKAGRKLYQQRPTLTTTCTTVKGPHIMASETVNPPEAEAARSEPMFERYVFSRKEVDSAQLPGGAVMRFVNLTHDIAAGAETLVGLLEWDDSREDFDDQRLLDSDSRNKISRLTSASLGLLLSEAYRMREWAYEFHTEEGRKDAHEAAIHAAACRC